MIRAVLDTNVVISALILKGPTNLIADLWHAKKFKWIVSKAIITEYVRVLAYPKFQLELEDVKRLVQIHILPYVTPVKVDAVPQVITEDPSDNIFLACANAGKCDYLVSGDQHLLVLKRYEDIPIVSTAEFLNAMA